MGKKDGKPRGKMTSYAFFVQTCRDEHKKIHPGENVVFSEFSKKCSERWKDMSDKEKQRFEAMAAEDKKRYDSEMENYIPPPGGEGKKRKKKQKDPNAPKRALSGFFFFCNEERPSVKQLHPEWTVGDIAKEMGRRWEGCTDRAKYEEMSAKDKARYEREITAYKQGILPEKKTKAPKVVNIAPVLDDIDDDDDEDDDDDDQ